MSNPEHVGRGVYTMPFLTQSGGMVLVSVTSASRCLTRIEVPAGDNPLPVMELLWSELNATDPASQVDRVSGSHIAIVATMLLGTSLAILRLYLLGFAHHLLTT